MADTQNERAVLRTQNKALIEGLADIKYAVEQAEKNLRIATAVPSEDGSIGLVATAIPNVCRRHGEFAAADAAERLLDENYTLKSRIWSLDAQLDAERQLIRSLRGANKKLRAENEHLRTGTTADVAQITGEVRERNQLPHAAIYALNAIDEHLAGSQIDWYDVRQTLERATYRSGQDGN